MKSKIRLTYNAPVTLTFALICLLVLALGYLTEGVSTKLFFSTYRSSLLDPFTYFRAISHVFGHVDWAHYFGNMTYILLLGPMIEEKYGCRMTIFMIFVTAIIASIVNNVFFSNVALCGASGICFLFIVLSSVTSIKKGEIPLTLILIIIIYLGEETYNMIFIHDSVSQISHILGGIVGGYFGLITKGGKYNG